ncbi:MAG: hypothetical protein ACN6O7_14405 [Sphingobacterium sp.]
MREKANSLSRLLVVLLWGLGCSLSKAQEDKDVALNDPRVEDSFSEDNVHYITETATAYYNMRKGK